MKSRRPSIKFKVDDKLATADVGQVPAYTCATAAQYIRIPVTTIRSWFFGMTYRNGKQFTQIFTPADEENRLLSFVNLAEAYVYRVLRTTGLDPKNIRKGLDTVAERFGSTHPLTEHQFLTDGVQLFMNVATGVECVSSDQKYFGWYKAWLDRVEWDAGVVRRIYPSTRHRSDVSAPRMVMFDPSISFGRMVTALHVVPTAAIAERFFAGESQAELASDFGCDLLEIEEAIRIERRLSDPDRKAA